MTNYLEVTIQVTGTNIINNNVINPNLFNNIKFNIIYIFFFSIRVNIYFRL